MGTHNAHDNCDKAVVIVAGGSGLRMGGKLPKQFMEIEGKPVLMHTIDAFLNAVDNCQVIVAIHADYEQWWKDHSADKEAYKDVVIAIGGASRTESVRKALFSLGRAVELVAVHDAVRPLVGKDLIITCFEKAATHKAVIPSIPLHDSIRKVGDDKNETANRKDFVAIQTPQCFERASLELAYRKAGDQQFSDDASLVEAMLDQDITLVDGSISNLKITRPEDLLMVEYLLWKRNQA